MSRVYDPGDVTVVKDSEGTVIGYEVPDGDPPLPRCRCARWRTYMGVYDADGYTLRCYGCLRAVANCWCG